MALIDVLTTLIEDLDFEDGNDVAPTSKQSQHKQTTPPSRVNQNHRGAVQPGTASYVAKNGGFGQNKNAKKQLKRLQKGVTKGPAKSIREGTRIVEQLKPWLTEGIKKP